eukprot:gene10549-12201_t
MPRLSRPFRLPSEFSAPTPFPFSSSSSYASSSSSSTSLCPGIRSRSFSPKEDSLLGGVPEFLVAVRSKLLVGPASYNIRDQPTYQEAFAKMEDYTLTEEELAK